MQKDDVLLTKERFVRTIWHIWEGIPRVVSMEYDVDLREKKSE